MGLGTGSIDVGAMRKKRHASVLTDRVESVGLMHGDEGDAIEENNHGRDASVRMPGRIGVADDALPLVPARLVLTRMVGKKVTRKQWPRVLEQPVDSHRRLLRWPDDA